MEQVIATINYFIREKLWCSIRKLCDLVSNLSYIDRYITNLILGFVISLQLKYKKARNP